MKSHIKDIMLIGGINYIGSLILAFIPDLVGELLGIIWLCLCVVLLVKFIWTKHLKILDKIKNKYPKFSFFMTSIGWFPYLTIIVDTILIAVNIMFPDPPILRILQNIYIVFDYVWAIGLLISIIYTIHSLFIKKRTISQEDKK